MRGSRDNCLEQLIFKARSSKSSILLFRLYKIVEEFRKIELHHLQFLIMLQCLGIEHSSICLLIQTETYQTLKFFRQILPLIRPNLKNTYVILDNHSSHRSNMVQDYIRQNRINVWFLPTYSSDLNPCEWIWKLFKDKWYKEQYRRYLNPKMFHRVYS